MAEESHRNMEFANFVCKFGEDKVLLDFADTIVVPALLSREVIKSYKSEFFMRDQQVVNWKDENSTIVGVIGRFFRNTDLEREQYYDRTNDTVVKDRRSLPSSPSAIFFLILNTHQLLFLHETAHAPTMQMFRRLAQKLLDKSHAAYLDKLLKERFPEKMNRRERAARKRDLYEEIPKPDVQLLPLSSAQTIEEFINKFSIVQRLVFELAETNHDLEGEALFSNFRQASGELKPSKARMQFQDNKDGLNKSASIKHINAASSQGINKVEISGKDQDGGQLKGDNESIKARTSLPTPEQISDMPGTARQMYDKFKRMVMNGIIRVSGEREGDNRKAERLVDKGQS